MTEPRIDLYSDTKSRPSPGMRKAISGENLQQLSGVTLAECVHACEDNSQCKSIDWKPQQSGCSLNKVARDEEDLDDHPDFFYYDMKCPEGQC